MTMGFTISGQVLTLVIIYIIYNCNADICINRITKKGGINKNFNGTEAFRHVYYNIIVDSTRNTRSGVLRQYIDNLINEIVLAFDEQTLLNPLGWCSKNKSTMNETLCCGLLNNAGFKVLGDSILALRHGYYNFVVTNSINLASDLYYHYLIDTILPTVGDSSALGPKEFCKKYKVQRCIDKIICLNGIQKHFNGKQAFEFAYHYLSYHNTKNVKSVDLHEYYNYLYDSAIRICRHVVFEKPSDWCKMSVSKLMNTNNEALCQSFLYSIGCSIDDNFSAALYNAYYFKTTTMDMNELTREYYYYLFNTFLPYINPSNILGPESYCNRRYSSNETTSANNQTHNIFSTQIPVDHQQPGNDYPAAQGLEQRMYFNPSLNSTFDEGSSSAPNMEMSLFFDPSSGFTSVGDENIFNDCNYKPPQ